jgi:hypothetical protein
MPDGRLVEHSPAALCIDISSWTRQRFRGDTWLAMFPDSNGDDD